MNFLEEEQVYYSTRPTQQHSITLHTRLLQSFPELRDTRVTRIRVTRIFIFDSSDVKSVQFSPSIVK